MAIGVTLFERDEVVGGQVRLAAAAPFRGELSMVTADLHGRCKRAGVEIVLGTDADPEVIRGVRPDTVVLATGARPIRPRWAGTVRSIVDVREVLSGAVVPTGRILVYDELGFHQATSVAELLADRGCVVTLATNALVVGQDLGLTLDLPGWLRRAAAKGIETRTDVVPMSAVAVPPVVSVQILHHPTGRVGTEAFDWVVCSLHQQPANELRKQLVDSEFDTLCIGDARVPRRIDAAIREGHRVGTTL